MKERQLLELKEKIDTAKTKLSELKGRKEHILQTLQEDHSCESVDDAENKVEKLSIQVESIQDKIDNKSEELENKYPQLYD